MSLFRFQVIGAGRSGTTLLASLIDAHPRCVALLEKLSRQHLYDAQSAPSERIEAFLAACEQEASVHEGLLWGHKTTTEHTGKLGEAGSIEFVRALSATPTIFIVRDGRTCVPSKMRRGKVSLDRAIELWKFSVWLLARFREAGGPLLVLKYEDLVTNAPRELAKVCAFLGVDYDDVMLSGTTNDKMQPVYRREGFDLPAAIGPAQSWFAEIANELAELGYGPGD